MARLEAHAFEADGTAGDGNFGTHMDGIVFEDFAAGFPAWGEDFPPEESCAGGEMNFRALLEANACVGNDGVGEVFEEGVFGERDFVGLHGRSGIAARAIDARGAGGGELDGGGGADVDGELEDVAAEEAAGNVVEMNESGAIFEREGADNFERRSLGAGGEDGGTGGWVELEIEI
jgi:hypothetical protein